MGYGLLWRPEGAEFEMDRNSYLNMDRYSWSISTSKKHYFLEMGSRCYIEGFVVLIKFPEFPC
jgi:hypothetical protein